MTSQRAPQDHVNIMMVRSGCESGREIRNPLLENLANVRELHLNTVFIFISIQIHDGKASRLPKLCDG